MNPVPIDTNMLEEIAADGYNPIELGKRIQQLRKARSVSQTRLAVELDIRSDSLSDIEHGRKGISIRLLINLADYFGVSTDYLLLGEK